jgi:hypothetical protein
LGTITAAQKIGGPIHGFVAGPKTVAETVAKVKGLEKVLIVDNAAYDKVSGSAIGEMSKRRLIFWFRRDCQKTWPL